MCLVIMFDPPARLTRSKTRAGLGQSSQAASIHSMKSARKGLGQSMKSHPISSATSITSEGDDSTPATSAIPTPASGSIKDATSSFEIRIPSESSSRRTSLRSAIAKRLRAQEGEDEDEDIAQSIRLRISSRWANKKVRLTNPQVDENDDGNQDQNMKDRDEQPSRTLRRDECEKLDASSSANFKKASSRSGGFLSKLRPTPPRRNSVPKKSLIPESGDDFWSDSDFYLDDNEDKVEGNGDDGEWSITNRAGTTSVAHSFMGEHTGHESESSDGFYMMDCRMGLLPVPTSKVLKSHRCRSFPARRDLDVFAILRQKNIEYGPVVRRSNPRSRDGRELGLLIRHHESFASMWQDLRDFPVPKAGKIEQPPNISRKLKNFQLEGIAWMKAMEKTKWKGGLLGDEMGLGKTIQAVSLIMSDWPQEQPTLVLVPPVALMQWASEIKSYTDGSLSTFVFHGTNSKAKTITAKDLKKYNVIMMSYNSLESMYRKQEKGFQRKDGVHMEKSVIHQLEYHRVILDEAHCIKTRTTMTAKACFALHSTYKWCLSGTPLQNRIGEFFSLVRFLNIKPFALYMCKKCSCESSEWEINDLSQCKLCKCAGVDHVSVFNQQLLNPIQKYGKSGAGAAAFERLRLLSAKIMLRRQKKDHMDAMELPVKEVTVDRQFFAEEENDFANSIMTNSNRQFSTYVAQRVVLNNYANIFGLIMRMRQVADHPDLILKRTGEGGQNVIVCCICDEPAEEPIRSKCHHDFCRDCAKHYVNSSEFPDCATCHIPLSIDLEQPELEQDEALVKKSSIINRIKMDKWTSSTKIELLIHELWKLRSDHATHKSIIFSQFTTMLQLIEWRLRRAGITTAMLDGSMSPAQRQASIDHFMNNINVECFLVSLRAGGVALNLTEASRVFIVDP